VVCRSVCHDRELYKSSLTDRDTVPDVDSVGPKEIRLRYARRCPNGKGHFWVCGRLKSIKFRILVLGKRVNCAKTDGHLGGHRYNK